MPCADPYDLIVLMKAKGSQANFPFLVFLLAYPNSRSKKVVLFRINLISNKEKKHNRLNDRTHSSDYRIALQKETAII